MVVHVTKSSKSLNKFVSEHSEKLIIIDFSAEWCGPCKSIAPAFKEMSKAYSKVKFVKLQEGDFKGKEHNPYMKYGISSFPTFLFIRNNKVIDKVIGANEMEITDKIKMHQ